MKLALSFAVGLLIWGYLIKFEAGACFAKYLKMGALFC